MTVQDFSEVLTRPKQILQIMLLQYGVQPFVAYLITRLLGFEGELALGFILLASVPGGTASNVYTYLANGDVPLSISATSFSTLLAPIVTPFLLQLYGSAYVPVEFWPMFLSIIQIVVLPIGLGLLVSTLLGDKTEKVEPVLPTVSSLGVLMVLLATVAVNRDALLSTGLLLVVAVLFLNLFGYATGYGLSKLLGYDTDVSRAAALEVGQQNSGLASSLGLEHFSPTTALAGAVAAVVHTLTGTLYARWCAAQDEKAESESTQQAVYQEQASNP
jgi:BASS family bile acid:Na+ symporter